MTHMYFSARTEGRISYGHLGCTSLLYGMNLWTELNRERCVGRQAKPKRLVSSVILVTHPKFYIDDGSPRFRRQTVKVEIADEDGCYCEKFRNFCTMGRARSKKQHLFAFLGYPSTILCTAYRKQFYPKPMVLMESQDSEGVPFASLESL